MTTAAAAPRSDAQDLRRQAAETVSLWKLACLLAPLAAVSLLVSHFGLESKAFFYLSVISFSGFAVHYFLPLPYRLPFFLALFIYLAAPKFFDPMFVAPPEVIGIPLGVILFFIALLAMGAGFFFIRKIVDIEV